MPCAIKGEGMGAIDFLKVKKVKAEMSVKEWQPSTTARSLIICDPEGKVEAVSVESQNFGPSISFPDEQHFSEMLGQGSDLTIWIAEQIADARRRNHYWAETTLDISRERSVPIFVRFETLTLGKDLRGFAIHIFPEGMRGNLRAIREGDAVVTKQQWHDIKNRLSVLKLYTTLLRKSLPEAEDQKTVEKLLNGIDALTKELVEIRRGDDR
jgi:hypothetical protein